MATLICPHCGGVREDYASIDILDLPPAQLRLLQALIEGQGRFQSKTKLIEKIYADDYDGGPEGAVGCLRKYICNLRRKLKKAGWDIQLNWGVGYRLIKLDEQAGTQ